MKKLAVIMMVVGLLTMTGCVGKIINKAFGVKTGEADVELRNNTIQKKYEEIKRIIVREAADNGFKELASETKPTSRNNWNGRLYFALRTHAGVDELVINFEGNEVKMNGSGIRTDPQAAIDEIVEQLKKL